jgi:hypothetical protein
MCTKYILNPPSTNTTEGFFLNKYLSFQSPVDIIPAVTKLLSSGPDNWEPAAIELSEKVLELIRPSKGNSVK